MSYIGQRPVVGRYIKLDQISSGFNGSNTGFSMTAGSQAVFPGTARNLLLSLGGVIQEPDTDFTISGSTLTFTTPPVANTTFFGVIYGDMQATGTPSDGTVLPASIASSGNFSFPEVTVTGDVNIADSIIHSGDTDTKIRFPAANKFSVETGGAERLSLGTTTVFNETGADVDFRIEGDTRQFLFYVDATNDRIGIDRSSPDAVFHIFDSPDHGNDRAALKVEAFRPKIRLQDRSSSANSAEVLCDSNALRFNVSVPSNDTTNLTERLRIDSSGKVGIGTTSPNTKLDVRDPSGTGLSSRSTATQATDTNKGLKVRNNSDTDTFSVSYKGQGYFAGNVGIGTTSPSSNLHVESSSPSVRLSDSDNSSAFCLFDGNGANLNIHADKGNNVSNSTMGFGIDNSIKMTLNSSGFLGIGTTSPTNQLHVHDGTNANDTPEVKIESFRPIIRFKDKSTSSVSSEIVGDNSLKFRVSTPVDDNTALTERMRIDSSGNVGIGTASPAANLHLKDGSSNTEIKLQGGSSTANDIIAFLNSAGSTRGNITYDTDNNFLLFNVNTSERMRINSSGSFLIGTTSDSIFNDTSGGGFNLKAGGQLVLAKEATSVADPLVWLNDTGQTTNKFIVFAQDGSEKANIGLAGNDATITVAGSERMRIDSSGRFMVGVTSSVVPFQVVAGASGFGGENTTGVFSDTTFPTTGVGGGVTFSGRYNSGASQVGFAALRGRKENGTVDGSDYAGALTFATRPNGGNMTERMRILSNGRIGFATASTTGLGSQTGNANVCTFNFAGVTLTQYSVTAGFYYDRLNFTNSQYFIVNSSGTGVYLGNGSTSFTAHSDERLKTNITELDSAKAYNHVKTARAASFKWNATGYPTDTKIGFIAQDWETDYPEVTNTTTETIDSVENPKGIQYTETIPVLMAALKQAISKIETLETEVAALKTA